MHRTWTVAATLVVLVAGHWATTVETAGKDDHDPSEIVVDEVVGQWIALFPVVFGAAHTGASVFALWPGIVAAFVLFRFVDKPVQRARRQTERSRSFFGGQPITVSGSHAPKVAAFQTL